MVRTDDANSRLDGCLDGRRERKAKSLGAGGECGPVSNQAALGHLFLRYRNARRHAVRVVFAPSRRRGWVTSVHFAVEGEWV